MLCFSYKKLKKSVTFIAGCDMTTFGVRGAAIFKIQKRGQTDGREGKKRTDTDTAQLTVRLHNI